MPAPLAAVPFTVNAPPVGAVTSLVNVSVVWIVLAAASMPVTTVVRELLVPCVQANGFDTNGVETVAIVCDQFVLAGPAVDVI